MAEFQFSDSRSWFFLSWPQVLVCLVESGFLEVDTLVGLELVVVAYEQYLYLEAYISQAV